NKRVKEQALDKGSQVELRGDSLLPLNLHYDVGIQLSSKEGALVTISCELIYLSWPHLVIQSVTQAPFAWEHYIRLPIDYHSGVPFLNWLVDRGGALHEQLEPANSIFAIEETLWCVFHAHYYHYPGLLMQLATTFRSGDHRRTNLKTPNLAATFRRSLAHPTKGRITTFLCCCFCFITYSPMSTVLEYLREPFLQISSIIFLAIILKYYFILKKKPTFINLPPSPPKLPIIGNLHQFGTTSSPHISLLNLSRKYGPIFYLNLGHIPTVIISSAKLAKEAFKTHDLAFASRPRNVAAEYLFYKSTDMVFSPYGAYWRYIRKVCVLEVFSGKRVQSFKLVRDEEVARLVRRLSGPYPATVNMSKMLGLYANDVLCRAAFGRDFSERGEHERYGFQEMLEEYQELLGGLSVGDFFPSMEFVLTFTGMKSRLIRTHKSFDKLFDRIIAEHRDPKRVKEDHSKDIVDVLLNIMVLVRCLSLWIMSYCFDVPKRNDENIIDMFAAGTDTTFIVLDWAMTELITNPKALEEAQAELQNVLGERKVSLKTFRLHDPPAPVLVPRESLEHVTIEGYDIPAKTRIIFNAWAIGRDLETWEDPELFKPERFLNSSIDFRGQDYELIPFGAGRRVCPAITFGIASIEIALAQLLHSFHWELPPDVTPKDLDMTEVFGITMHRKVGLEVLAKPRFS
ncbi:hypothetical protein G4B88_009912, partial [Cannabis sativa]